jgi:hypothetical protein
VSVKDKSAADRITGAAQLSDCLVGDVLPAIPAATATAATTTAASTAAAPVTTKAAYAPATSPATALRFRTRFVDVHRTAIEFTAVQAGDGCLGFATICHFDERESPGLPRIAIGDDIYTLDGAILRKGSGQLFPGRLETQVSYENIGHLAFL